MDSVAMFGRGGPLYRPLTTSAVVLGSGGGGGDDDDDDRKKGKKKIRKQIRNNVADAQESDKEFGEQKLEQAGTQGMLYKQWMQSRLYGLYKKYGRTAIVLYVGLDVVSLSTCFVIAKTGVDVSAIFSAVGLTPEYWLGEDPNNFWAAAGVAFALNKLTMPVRWTLTGLMVPTLARTLKKNYPKYF